MKHKRIGVVMGGLSSEREVSLETGAGVLAALKSRGYACAGIDWAPDTSLPSLLTEARIDVVWNALHGTFGEDGAVQGLCACMGIACTGSGILASALAMDKVASKRIFESHNLATPRWAVIERGDDLDEALNAWELPVVIKPANEGSSVGVTVLAQRGGDEGQRMRDAVDLARRYQGPTIIEEYIAGAEIQTGILDNTVLGSIEVRPANPFYDYEAKYKRNDTEYIIPATIAAAAIERAEASALAAHRALACTGYSRVDLRVTPAGQALLLEVNTLPGMTSHSLLPKIAAHAGIDYATLCDKILALAERHGPVVE